MIKLDLKIARLLDQSISDEQAGVRPSRYERTAQNAVHSLVELIFKNNFITNSPVPT